METFATLGDMLLKRYTVDFISGMQDFQHGLKVDVEVALNKFFPEKKVARRKSQPAQGFPFTFPGFLGHSNSIPANIMAILDRDSWKAWGLNSTDMSDIIETSRERYPKLSKKLEKMAIGNVAFLKYIPK